MLKEKPVFLKIFKGIFILFLLFTITCLFLKKSKVNAYEPVEEGIIKVSMKSMNTSYSTVLSPFSYNDFCKLNIVSSGGEHTVSGKKLVYSNYVEVGIELNIDSSRNIKGTSERIVDDGIKKLNSSFCGESYKLPTRMGYGVVLVARAYSNGKLNFDSPIYIGREGNGINSLRFTDDADYHIFIIFKSTGTKTCYNVIEYIIPIRTYSYVRDIETDLDVKESKCFYGPVKIDCLGRDVDIQVNGVEYGNYRELTAPAKYHIAIFANGFLCESYDFTIFDEDTDNLFVMVENLRSVLDDSNSEYIVYEAEHSFIIKWNSKYPSSAKYSYNYGELEDFSNGFEFTDKGLYYIIVSNDFTKTSYQYLIYLVEDDSPCYNYKKLIDAQDHSMTPFWYEVYDEVSESNLCFKTYPKALQASLSLETEKVEFKGTEYIYENKKYTYSYEYINVLEDNAKKNIKQKFLDIDNVEELYFQNELIEDDLFLDPDFTFTFLNVFESSEINLVGSGIDITVDYDTPIKEYNLPSGNYRVIEKDKFGNSTYYDVIYDTEKPNVLITIDNGNKVSLGSNIECRYFTFTDISDELDKYVVVKVNDEYLLNTDYLDYYFTEPMTYSIKAYDRSGNVLEGSVTVANKLANLVDNNGSVVLNLNSGVSITKVICNGEEISISIPRFYAKEEDQYYQIFVKDKEDNVNNTYNYNKTYIILISIGLGLIPIAVGIIILAVGAKKDERNS